MAVLHTTPSHFPSVAHLAHCLQSRIDSTRRIHGLTIGNQAGRTKARKRVGEIAGQVEWRPCRCKSTRRSDSSRSRTGQETSHVRCSEGQDFKSYQGAVSKIPG